MAALRNPRVIHRSARARIASLAAVSIAALSATTGAPQRANAADTDVVVREATGKAAADIKPAIDEFRVDLGGGTTPGTNGSFGGQGREINWDGVPDQFASPNDMPPDFFNVNSPRGAVFSTPGIAFQLSAKAGLGVPVRFGNLNPLYTNDFGAFSAERIFAPIASTVTNIDFFLPGTKTKGVVKGFGAVFTDVDSAESSSIEAFGIDGSLLGKRYVTATPGSASFSFVGISLPGVPRIARVRITSGGLILSDGLQDSAIASRDKVAIDDLVYGEPVAAPSPLVAAPPLPTAVTNAVAATVAPTTVVTTKPVTTKPISTSVKKARTTRKR